MRLTTTHRGARMPFEGDRTLVLRALPAGAVVRRARLTVTPVTRPGAAAAFEETFSFAAPPGADDLPGEAWGLSQVPRPGSVEVDLHGRRQLAAVAGANLNTANLLIDAGGLFVRIDELGGILTPSTKEFTLHPDGLLPGLETGRFRLARAGLNPPVMTTRTVTVRSAPHDLTARIGVLAPFWTLFGPFTGPVTSPDFADVLRGFLDASTPVDGVHVVPVALHVDGIARLDVSLDVEFLSSQPLLRDGLPEVNMAFGASGEPDEAGRSLAVQLPADAQVAPGATTARVVGGFDPTRIGYRVAGEARPVATVPVSSGQTQAQALEPAAGLTVTHVDLFVAATQPHTILAANLRPDADGRPTGDPLLAEPLTVRLDLATPAPAWITTTLPAPLRLRPGVPVWLILEVLQGAGVWGVAETPLGAAGLLTSTDGGISWRPRSAAGVATTASGLARLRTTPDRFEVPVRLEAGVTGDAERVSLERFAPLGRVDLTLDGPELPAAVNGYLRRTSPPTDAPQEQLHNDDFSRWTEVGRDLMPPATVRLVGSPVRMAIAPDGLHGYVWSTSAQGEDLRSEIEPVDLVCNTAAPPITLPGQDEPAHLVVHPDGRTLYAIVGAPGEPALLAVDLRAGEPLGARVPLGGTVAGIALNGDGSRLYLAWAKPAAPWRVLACDPGRLADALRGSGQAEDAAVAAETITLGADESIVDFTAAVDRAAARLCILFAKTTSAGGSRGLYLVDAPGSTPGTPVALTATASALAVTRDGRTAVVLNGPVPGGSNTLAVVDLDKRTVTDQALALPGAERSVVVAPDGSRAFLVGAGHPTLDVMDLAGRRVEARINVGPRQTDVAITPQGDVVYCLSPDTAGVTEIRVGARVPTDWTVTAGAVEPFCLGAPRHLAVGLGSVQAGPAPAAGLSQVLAVRAGAAYDFSVDAAADRSGCAAEVHWLADGCDLVASVAVPITVVEELARALAGGQVPPLVLHRQRVTAPTGSTQAEVRLRVPAGATALVDRVSLAGPAVPGTTNDDLRLRDAGAPANWATAPPDAAISLTDPTTAGAGILVSNDGTVPGALTQTVDATAGEPFEVEFDGRVVAAGENPRLELAWLTVGGDAAAADVVCPLDALDFDVVRVAGLVPASASRAVLRIVLPAKAAVEVTAVSLRLRPVAEVPVRFVSQAPGELTVSRARVAYDRVPAPPPAAPATGLCRPTPPDRRPGTTPEDDTDCPDCDTDAKPAAADGPVPTGAPVDGREAIPRVMSRESVTGAMEAPLAPGAVAGVGVARAGRLSRVGIDTRERLAAASPVVVGQVLGVSASAAALLIHAARNTMPGRRLSLPEHQLQIGCGAVPGREKEPDVPIRRADPAT